MCPVVPEMARSRVEMARFARTEAPLTRRALITGITGQDGSYLAEHLLTQGYEVWGLVRGQSNPRVRGVRQLLGDIRLVRGDLLDQGSLIAAVEKVQPDEVYNLAAISYVPMSWQQAELTGEVTGIGRAPGAGGDPGVQRDQRVAHAAGRADPLLPGVLVGDVRPGPGEPADRADPVPPAQPVRGGQGVRALPDPELP